jgi:hypothetical protein
MRDAYISCPKRSDQMGRPKKVTAEIQNTEENTVLSPTENLDVEIKNEIIDEKPKTPKIKKQTKICKVLYKSKNKFSIDFDGYGVGLIDPSPNKTDDVEINYVGEFGTKTFEIISHKFI